MAWPWGLTDGAMSATMEDSSGTGVATPWCRVSRTAITRGGAVRRLIWRQVPLRRYTRTRIRDHYTDRTTLCSMRTGGSGLQILARPGDATWTGGLCAMPGPMAVAAAKSFVP